MAKRQINKIIYFDKETIRNILQEWEKGQVTTKTDVNASIQSQGSIGMDVSSKVKLDVPFFARLSFLFSAKLEASFVSKLDSTTTISSTEISEFEKLKPALVEINDVALSDIENSSTSLRVAGGYLRIVKSGVEGVDTREFKTVMDSYDGYDTYRVDRTRYVRFNNAAFVSNYKRNDLLTTRMTIYCIPVGVFPKDRFDFIKEIQKMQTLLSSTHKQQSLADIFPPQVSLLTDPPSIPPLNPVSEPPIQLFDAIYACVSTEGKKK